jgi:hypothetical protein
MYIVRIKKVEYKIDYYSYRLLSKANVVKLVKNVVINIKRPS